MLPDLVHADVLRGFPELVAELGGDPYLLLAEAGIGAGPIGRGRRGATYSQLVALLERTAATLACPDFGLKLAMRQHGLPIFGPLGPVMRNSRTFGEALRYVADHAQAHSLAAQIWLRDDPDEGTIFVGHDILLGGFGAGAQAVEQIMLLGHLGAIELTGGAARVRHVHFRHQPGLPPRAYRRYFGCDVDFGRNADGVFFLASDFAAPIVDPDTRLYGEAAARIDAAFGTHRPPLQAQVRGILLRELADGRCTNAGVAARLDLHVRALHRQLAAEGTSFQRIKDEVRRDMMLYYLRRTTFDFGEISERLGFAEQCVMTRFCNHMLGAAPTAIRRAALRERDARPGFIQSPDTLGVRPA